MPGSIAGLMSSSSAVGAQTVTVERAVLFDRFVQSRLQDIVETNFKLYKRVADDEAFARVLVDWLYDRFKHEVGEEGASDVGSGRSTKLVGQAGEYLVAGELARRGLISTTFTGNVPHYDIIASNECGKHVSVQVKTITGRTWQFDISKFCDISWDGDRQIVGDRRTCPIARLVCVLVVLRDRGEDEFCVLPWERLRDILVADYAGWLEDHGGVRPKNTESLHTALRPQQVARHEDNWKVVEQRLR